MQSDAHGAPAMDAVRADVSPQSVEDLREALLSRDGSVFVLGNGTKQTFANRADPPDLTISTRNLNQVLQYEPADMTIALEAGTTLAELNRVLGEHNQVVPLDAHRPESATLGGLFASGLAGPRRFRYGSLRDMVVGLEVMAPDGILTKSGGMVVKNVTGYDLPRLHHGAHGAFGVVTRLNLKVFPKEQESRSILATFGDVADAYDAATAIIRSQLEPSSVTVSANDGWLVSVVCDGPESTIDAQAEALADVARSASDPKQVEIFNDADAALAVFHTVIDTDAHPALARLSAPASRQLDAVRTLATLAGSHICADPGSGLIYVAGVPSPEWREAVRRVVPDAVFLALPDELKADVDVFGPVDPHSLRLLKRLKNEFDPERRLNRGRFISGI